MDNFIRRISLAHDAARAANKPLRVSMMLESGTAVGGLVSEVTGYCVVVRADREASPVIVRADAIVSVIIREG